jgi:hypothetical protein
MMRGKKYDYFSKTTTINCKQRKHHVIHQDTATANCFTQNFLDYNQFLEQGMKNECGKVMGL